MQDSRFTEINVHPGSKVEMPFEVSGSGHVLKWEFMTRHANIGFWVFYHSEPGASKDQWEAVVGVSVVEKTRCHCHIVPEIGGCSCTKPGTCQFQKFDIDVTLR
ncbi:SEC14-like protein 2 [Diadema antillarum]|uniref:SEC14-like protein 2 n=1 Tax=Diadema antillarum TaxID=105358 RepID=UPI003A881F4A